MNHNATNKQVYCTRYAGYWWWTMLLASESWRISLVLWHCRLIFGPVEAVRVTYLQRSYSRTGSEPRENWLTQVHMENDDCKEEQEERKNYVWSA